MFYKFHRVRFALLNLLHNYLMRQILFHWASYYSGGMIHSTLSFLMDTENQKILLAMKKKGFGAGKWNGMGGKFDKNKKDRNLIDTAIRETREEIGVESKSLEDVATLKFYFPKPPHYRVEVFIVKSWENTPRESEEMKPRWFKMKEIPYNKMWIDDQFWLPKVLNNRKVKAEFTFGEGEKIIKKNVKETR